jgi:hypothetical protein
MAAAVLAGSLSPVAGQDKNITTNWEVVRMTTPTGGDTALPRAATFTRGKEALHYGVQLQPQQTSAANSPRGAVILDFMVPRADLVLGTMVPVELALSGTTAAANSYKNITTNWEVIRITPMIVGGLTRYELQLQLRSTSTDKQWGDLSLSSTLPYVGLAAGDIVPVTFTLPGAPVVTSSK